MDLDVTLIVQLLIFLTLLVTLQGILFKPFLGVLEARHAKMEGAQDEIGRLQRLGAEDLEKYQTRIREARDLALRERDALRNQGREEERRLLNEVRAEITRTLNEAREKVSTAERDARQQLSAETEALARRMVEKVLGREVTR